MSKRGECSETDSGMVAESETKDWSANVTECWERWRIGEERVSWIFRLVRAEDCVGSVVTMELDLILF